MGSYAVKKTSTVIQDISQVAEAEAVAGVGSTMALPGSIALGEGAKLSITTTAEPEKALTSMDSTIGKLLGLTSQMAQGIFETAPAIAAQVASETQGLFTSKLTELGTGLSELGTKVGVETKESGKYIMYGLIGLGLVFLLKRK